MFRGLSPHILVVFETGANLSLVLVKKFSGRKIASGSEFKAKFTLSRFYYRGNVFIQKKVRFQSVTHIDIFLGKFQGIRIEIYFSIPIYIYIYSFSYVISLSTSFQSVTVLFVSRVP